MTGFDLAMTQKMELVSQIPSSWLQNIKLGSLIRVMDVVGALWTPLVVIALLRRWKRLRSMLPLPPSPPTPLGLDHVAILPKDGFNYISYVKWMKDLRTSYLDESHSMQLMRSIRDGYNASEDRRERLHYFGLLGSRS